MDEFKFVEQIQALKQCIANLQKQIDPVRLELPSFDGLSLEAKNLLHELQGTIESLHRVEAKLRQQAEAMEAGELAVGQQQHDRALQQELTKRAQFDHALQRVQDQVCASFDEGQILQTAVQELTLALKLHSCDTAIYDLEAATSHICCHYTAIGKAAASKVGAIAMADFAEGYRQLLGRQEFQFCEITNHPVRNQLSILVCPIADRQTVLGDLWCFSPQQRVLNSSEVQLVKQMAVQCAIGLRQTRLRQENQSQASKLEALNRAKDNFLSMVSHELRTPLTNIRMAIYLLKATKNEAQSARYLEILQTECNREIELVTDLLDLQQMENDQFHPCLIESIVLQDWLPTIAAPLQTRFQGQHGFKMVVPEDLAPFNSDRASLRRILHELLLNAYKYTRNGGAIEFCVEQTPNNQICFIVRNQAEISPDVLPHIFEKFYRESQVDTWQVGGTGLGLTIVKQLVARLQGAISVVSQNDWTTFTVCFALNR